MIKEPPSPAWNLEILEVIGNSVVIFEVIKNPGNMKVIIRVILIFSETSLTIFFNNIVN